MKRLLSAVLLLCASVCAWGQGATVLFPPLQGPNGTNIPFAKITFCSVNSPQLFDSLGNCTQTVTVYQNITLATPYSSAIQTDGLGNLPPNQVTTTALYFSPAQNYCYTATGSVINQPVPICTPFSVSVATGSSPTFAAITTTAGPNIFAGNTTLNGGTLNGSYGGNPTFAGAVTAGSVTSQNVNGILYVGPGNYATIAAAVTAAGSNKTLGIVQSNYAGTECPSYVSNIMWLDLRGGNISVSCTQNDAGYNSNDGVVYAGVKDQFQVTGTLNLNGSAVNHWFLTVANNVTANNAVIDGISPEAALTGTVTNNLPIVSANEAAVLITTTGGSVTTIYGNQGYFNDTAGRTTPITNVIGEGGIGCNSVSGTPKPTNCYGLYGKSQTNKASGDNYALAWEGLGKARYDAFFGGDFLNYEDSGGTSHNILWSNGTNIFLQGMGAGGIFFNDSGGSSHFVMTASAFTPASAGSETIGSGPLPFSDLFGGTAATNNFDIHFGNAGGARVISVPDFGASSGVTQAQFPATVVLHTAYTNATTVFSTVGDGTRSVAFPVAATTDYTLVCDFVYQASASTAGPKFQVTGPASPTAVKIDLVAFTSTTQAAGAPTNSAAHGNAFGTSVSSGTAIGQTATDLTVRVTVGVVNGANAGTLTLQAASQGVGTLTLQPGSACRMQ